MAASRRLMKVTAAPRREGPRDGRPPPLPHPRRSCETRLLASPCRGPLKGPLPVPGPGRPGGSGRRLGLGRERPRRRLGPAPRSGISPRPPLTARGGPGGVRRVPRGRAERAGPLPRGAPAVTKQRGRAEGEGNGAAGTPRARPIPGAA